MFRNCKNLKSIELSDNITVIDDFAFYGCENLTNVIIPNNVERIGFYTFSCCYNIGTITIPGNVKKIEAAAFDSCWLKNNKDYGKITFNRIFDIDYNKMLLYNDPFVIIEVPSEAKSLYESLFAEFRSWCNNPLNTF